MHHYGFSIILHYISYDLGCFWNDLSKSKQEMISSLQESAEAVPPDKLFGYCGSIKEIYKNTAMTHLHLTALQEQQICCFCF